MLQIKSPNKSSHNKIRHRYIDYDAHFFSSFVIPFIPIGTFKNSFGAYKEISAHCVIRQKPSAAQQFTQRHQTAATPYKPVGVSTKPPCLFAYYSKDCAKAVSTRKTVIKKRE